MTRFNEKRKAKMQARSERDLLEIAKTGSLSSSAAEWELKHRGFYKSVESIHEDRKVAKNGE